MREHLRNALGGLKTTGEPVNVQQYSKIQKKKV